MKCPTCKCEEVKFIETPDILHYGKEECAECGRHIKWVKAPKRSDKEAKGMDIREDFKEILADCEARYAVSKPHKGSHWEFLSEEDYIDALQDKVVKLFVAKTDASAYYELIDVMLLLFMVASKKRKRLSWQSRLGVEVIQKPLDLSDIKLHLKKCEEQP